MMAGSRNSNVLADAARDPKVRTAVASAAVAAGGAVAAGKLVRDRIAERSESRRRRSYRLRIDEPVAEGVRRIARGQIDLAVELLGKTDGGELDDAIHEARKTFKRVRALVRVARDGLGDETYGREDETFREAGRGLSNARDAQVMVQTLEDLASRYADETPGGGFRGLHDVLSAEARAAHDQIENDAATVRDVLVTLRAARARVESWPLPESDDLGFLAPGFERIYRRGRRAQRAAGKRSSTEALHELRKRAKDLWHAAQVLRPAAPKRMRKLARLAHSLSDVAGEDHDLAVLLDGARERARTLGPRELQLLDALIARRRAVLQEEALKRGRRLYRRKPSKLARRIAAATISHDSTN
jgi:CHAD domain-containing protein